jgi:hypothetical protein
VAVTPVNDAQWPTQMRPAPINTPLLSINVLGNDTDAEGDPLTVTAASVERKAPSPSTPDGTLNFTQRPIKTGPVQITHAQR